MKILQVLNIIATTVHLINISMWSYILTQEWRGSRFWRILSYICIGLSLALITASLSDLIR